MKKPTALLPLVFAIFVLTLFCGPALWAGRAAAMEIQVDSTSFAYDAEKKLYRYEDARIRIGPLTVDARVVEFDLKENRFLATGDVRFSDGGVVGAAERVEMDLNLNTGVFYSAQLFDSATGYYLSAERMTRVAPGRFRATQCTLTSCSPGTGGWKLEVGELDYRGDAFATGTNAVLKLGPVPVFYFPFLAWPTVRERRSGFLMPSFGTERSSEARLDLGTWIKLPFFWALGVDQDLTLTSQLFERRDAGLGLEYAYAFWEDQKGSLKGFAIQESASRDNADELPAAEGGSTAGETLPPSRHYFDWRHNQGFGQSGRLVFSLSQSSDGQVRREYQRIEEHRPYQDYEGSFSLLGGWANLALTASHGSEFNRESIFAGEELLSDGEFRPALQPRLAVETGGRPFAGSALTLSLSGHATAFSAETGLSGNVVQATPAISYPFRLGSTLQIRPSVERRFVRFEELTLPSGDPPVDEGAAAGFAQDAYRLELRLPLARIYPANGDGEGADLKHRLVPRLIYDAVQDTEQPLAGTLSLADRQTFDAGGVPAAPRAGIIPERISRRLWTLRLDNVWLSRAANDPAGAAVEKARFNFIQRYNAELEDPDFLSPQIDVADMETEPGEPLLPAILEGNWAGGGLTISGRARYHHQKSMVVETGLTLAKKNSASGAAISVTYRENKFQYRSLDNVLHAAGKTLAISAEKKSSDRVKMGVQGNLNLADDTPSDRRLENARVFVDYTTSCYGLTVSYQQKMTAVAGTTDAIVDRSILLTFSLGRSIPIQFVQILGGG